MSKKSKQKRKKKRHQQRKLAKHQREIEELFRYANEIVDEDDEGQLYEWIAFLAYRVAVTFSRYLCEEKIDHEILIPCDPEEDIYLKITYEDYAHYINFKEFFYSILYMVDDEGIQCLDYEFLTDKDYCNHKAGIATINKIEEILDMIDEIDEQPNKKGA